MSDIDSSGQLVRPGLQMELNYSAVLIHAMFRFDVQSMAIAESWFDCY